jgi:DNA repair exonuclease SbcCD ATPase subunit
MISKKIPKSDFVISIIKEVLKKRGVVQSQEDLCLHVLDELKKCDKKYVLSPRRVKELVIKIPNVEIKAKTKKVPKMTKLEKCPVCGKKVDKIYGKNLLNKKIHIGYICKRCGYITDLESFTPMKYIFVLKK